jgi:glycosyltransferase involved in cell wall biosynthesis
VGYTELFRPEGTSSGALRQPCSREVLVLRICIDGTPLLMNSAGIKTYLYHWLKSLKASRNSHHLTVFPGIRELDDLEHQISLKKQIPAAWRLALVAYLNWNRNSSWLASVFCGAADLFHTSKILDPPKRNMRLTATIHDVTAWLMPQLHTPHNVAGDRRFAQMVLKRADRLIAVSHNSKRDAVEVLGLSPDRIDVIHNGVAEAYFQVGDEAAAAATRKYGLKRPYVLFNGAIEPRKNIDILLDAYESLSPSLRQEFELILAGPMGWAAAGTVQRLRSGDSGARYLGYVPEGDLPGLTRAATLLVYPSLYEGFGFPVAQAMAAGVPTITSNVSSLPEVADGAALLVDPRSVAELSSGLRRLLLSPSLRGEMITKGRLRAESFRWKESAVQSWRFFEKTLGT